MKKNKKIVSILLTLAFMASLIMPSAVFAADKAAISGTYKYVKADTAQAAGAVTFATDDAFAVGAINTVYYEINLPSGIEVTDGLAANVSGEPAGSTVTKSGVSGSETAAAFNAAPIAIGFNSLDIDTDVTGNVVAEAKVWGYSNANGVVWEYTSNVTIAKINSGNVAISAEDPEVVSVGTNQVGAKLTVKEGTPGALELNDEIFVTILTSGVEWDQANTAVSDAGNIAGVPNFTSDKIVKLTIDNPSSAAAAKLEITPAFKVTPGTTGDIKVKISGDVDTTEAKVATIGEGSVAVSLKDNDSTIYLGDASEVLDAEVTLDPSTEFKAEDYFTVTLPKGFKWVAASDNSANLAPVELINDDQTAWFTFTGDESADVKLTNLTISADYNAAVGDIKATCDGAVKGEIVIGKAAAPVNITTSKVNVPLKGTSVAAGDITITEADAGVVGAGAVLDLTLPMGVTFAKLPSVEVTDGDMTLDATEVNFGTDKSILEININHASNVASTIKLTDIAYNIDNRASLGAVNIEVGAGDLNAVSDNALAVISNATIVSDTASASAFVIGSTSYTVNGVTKTLDAAPYIKNDRTYLPLRFVANAVGVSDENIIWNAADQSVVIIKGDRVVKLAIGNNTMYVNGIAVQMDTAAEISNGRTMLPVRWVAQALGATINWDAATQTVTVDVK